MELKRMDPWRNKLQGVVQVAFVLATLGLFCAACFSSTKLIVRGMSLFVAVAFAFIAFCFFERIKLGDAFLKSHTGKSGFPGSVKACVGGGTLMLSIAGFLVYCAFRRA